MGKKFSLKFTLPWIAATGFLCTGIFANLPAAEFPYCESFGLQRLEEKKEAIPFCLKDLDGKQVSLSDFKGKPVLIFFWASW